MVDDLFCNQLCTAGSGCLFNVPGGGFEIVTIVVNDNTAHTVNRKGFGKL